MQSPNTTIRPTHDSDTRSRLAELEERVARLETVARTKRSRRSEPVVNEAGDVFLPGSGWCRQWRNAS
jgi:hypothetical protein